MLKLTVDGNSVLLEVKVVPGASRTRYLGEWDGRARIAVAAPPERGKANQALVKFLAEALKMPKSRISVVTGHGNPLKTVRISQSNIDAVCAALEPKQRT